MDNKGTCIVEDDEMTLEEIAQIMASQGNTGTPNERNGSESAFDVALRGSKVYLEAHGFLSEEE